MSSTPRAQYLWYMSGIVTWVAPLGLQTILYAWLIAVQLQESPERLGVAQMMMQLPGIFLMLVGGLAADRIDPRRILCASHLLASLPAFAVAYLLYTSQLTYAALILYALTIGTAGAFVVPARDSMLNRVAGGQVQRTVTVAMGLYFGTQLLGFIAGSAADATGGVPLLILQGGVLLLGVLTALRLTRMPVPAALHPEPGSRAKELTKGLAVVLASAAMRPALAMLFLMSVFYGGTFLVLNPLVVRDIYAGSAFEISLSYAAFVIGTIAATVLLLAIGGLRRPGLAMLVCAWLGAACLAATLAQPPLAGYLAAIFLWGVCGGVAMSMGRTIMQEQAPEALRARVMAAFSLANTGGMPIGSILLGYCAQHLGVLGAMAVVIIGASLGALALWQTTALASLVSLPPPRGSAPTQRPRLGA